MIYTYFYIEYNFMTGLDLNMNKKRLLLEWKQPLYLYYMCM